MKGKKNPKKFFNFAGDKKGNKEINQKFDFRGISAPNPGDLGEENENFIGAKKREKSEMQGGKKGNFP